MERMDAPPGAIGTPKVYIPEQFEKLLVMADAKFPELLPFLVLTGVNRRLPLCNERDRRLFRRRSRISIR
jgi:hypothetical protein